MTRLKFKTITCIFLCLTCCFNTLTHAEEATKTLVDEKTGIQIVIDHDKYINNSCLIVECIDNNSDTFALLEENLDNAQKDFAESYSFYNIYVASEKNEKIPYNVLGEVTVRIPIADNLDENDLKVLQVIYGDNNDITTPGEIIQMYSKKYFEFKATELSKLALVDIDSKKVSILLVAVFSMPLIIAMVYFFILKLKNNKVK